MCRLNIWSLVVLAVVIAVAAVPTATKPTTGQEISQETNLSSTVDYIGDFPPTAKDPLEGAAADVLVGREATSDEGGDGQGSLATEGAAECDYDCDPAGNSSEKDSPTSGEAEDQVTSKPEIAPISSTPTSVHIPEATTVTAKVEETTKAALQEESPVTTEKTIETTTTSSSVTPRADEKGGETQSGLNGLEEAGTSTAAPSSATERKENTGTIETSGAPSTGAEGGEVRETVSTAAPTTEEETKKGTDAPTSTTTVAPPISSTTTANALVSTVISVFSPDDSSSTTVVPVETTTTKVEPPVSTPTVAPLADTKITVMPPVSTTTTVKPPTDTTATSAQPADTTTTAAPPVSTTTTAAPPVSTTTTSAPPADTTTTLAPPSKEKEQSKEAALSPKPEPVTTSNENTVPTSTAQPQNAADPQLKPETLPASAKISSATFVSCIIFLCLCASVGIAINWRRYRAKAGNHYKSHV